MTSRISPEDWEILSAYIDGQVSAREQEKLKQKLDTEPELQRALEELQRTKMVLRSAPRRRVPHNFTLTPDMVPQRRPWFRLVPTFSFASAMAGILLVLTFAFRSLSGLTGAVPLAPLPASATQVARSSNLAATQVDQSTQGVAGAPIIVWGGGSGGGGGAGGGYGGAGPSEATGLGGGPASTETVPPGKGQDLGATPTPEPGVGGNEPLPTLPPEYTLIPEPTTGPSIAALPTATPPVPSTPPGARQPQAPLQGEGPILGIRPTQEMGKIVVEPGTDQFTAPQAPTATPAASESFLNRYLGPIQIGLGILALALAVAAFILHRKS